jgi:uncharacterized membrane protein YczE
LFWRFLNLKIGLGTVLNFIIIAIMIDVTIYFLDQPNEFFTQLFMVIIGVLLVGFGSSLYLIANLGAGPRDGLMTGLQKKTNAPIALVRFCIELFVVLCGWFLGGVFGVGTIVYAIGVGPAVALGISNFKR